MILRHKMRLFALIVAACIVGMVVFEPFKRLAFENANATFEACENARKTETEAEACGDALDALDTAISRYGNDDQAPVLLRNRAWVKYLLDDLEGSLSDTNESVKLDPNSAWAWYWRGRLSMLAGDVETAIADYRMSSKVDPLYCWTDARLRKMAYVLWRVGRTGPSALNEILEKRKYVSHVADLAFVEYLANHADGPYNASEEVLDQLTQSTDRPEHLTLLLARINARSGRQDVALEQLDTLTEHPDLYDIISEQMRTRLYELEAAGKSCETEQFSFLNRKYLFLYQDSLELEFDILKDLEKWESALVSLDELIVHRPTRHVYWTNRGEVLDRLGREDDALASYLENIRLARPENDGALRGSAPELLQALFRVASIYETQGRSAEALVIWDESLSVARTSVIGYVQEMMELAGHYEGDHTRIYDDETKTAVRVCLADAECNRVRLRPLTR